MKKNNTKNKFQIGTIIVLNIIVFILIIVLIAKDVSQRKREVYDGVFTTAENVREATDTIVNNNISITRALATTKEAASFASEGINYYNVSLFAERISDMGIMYTGDIYAFVPGRDFFVTRAAAYHEDEIVSVCGVLPYDTEHLISLPDGCYSAHSMVDGIKKGSLVLINKCTTIKGDTICFILVLKNELLENSFSNVGTTVCLTDKSAKGEIIYCLEEQQDFERKEIYAEVKSKIMPGWEYVAVSNEKIGAWMYMKYILLMLFLMLVVSFLGVLVSDRLNKLLHKIITIVNNKVGGEEIERLNNKIEKMMKKTAMIEESARRYLDGYEKQLLKSIIFGNISAEELEQYKKNNPSVTKNAQYTLVVLETEDVVEANVKSQIILYLEEITAGRVLEIDNKRIAVITPADVDTARKSFISAIVVIEQQWLTRYVGVIPRESIDDIELLSKLYAVADRTIKNKGCCKHNNVIIADEIKNSNNYWYDVEVEKNILDLIECQRFDEAFAAIEEVINNNLVENILSRATLSDFKLAIATTIKRTLQILGRNENELFGDGCIIYLELGATGEQVELVERIKEIFKTIFDSYESEDDIQRNMLIENVLKYMHENYGNEDLVCQTAIAEKFNVSTGHLSRIFKKNVGLSYKEYLTKYRIQQAICFFDRERYIKIKEVSEKVGYTNSKSFARAFERITGMTPGAYKKQLEKKN